MKSKLRLCLIVLFYIISFILMLGIVSAFSRSERDYYAPISKLEFGNRNYSSYIKNGFGDIEPNFRWSVGKYSNILIPLSPGRNYKMNVNIKPIESEYNQVVKISVNGHAIGEQHILNNNEYLIYSFDIPSEAVNSSNDIRFEYSNPVSPHELNALSNDTRELAVNFESILFQEIK